MVRTLPFHVELERRHVGASVVVVQNARKASLVAGPLVHVAEPKPGPKKSRRRKPYSPARGVGRPSGYRPELVERAYRMSLLGLTDQQLADFLGISGLTVEEYIDRLGQDLIPLAERCARVMREALAALEATRGAPSQVVERSRA